MEQICWDFSVSLCYSRQAVVVRLMASTTQCCVGSHSVNLYMAERSCLRLASGVPLSLKLSFSIFALLRRVRQHISGHSSNHISPWWPQCCRARLFFQARGLGCKMLRASPSRESCAARRSELHKFGSLPDVWIPGVSSWREATYRARSLGTPNINIMLPCAASNKLAASPNVQRL